MRHAILVLSLLMFASPLALRAVEAAKPAEAKITADAPKVLKEAVPAEAKPVEGAPVEAAPAPAETKPVLKVVEEPKAAATTDPIPDDPEEAILLIEQLVKAAQAGQWQLFVGLLLTFIVWVLRKFNIISFLPSKAVPWVAAAIGMLGYLGVSLASGLALLPAILQGLLVGAAAVGLWEMLGKHILKKKKAEAPPAPKAEEATA